MEIFSLSDSFLDLSPATSWKALGARAILIGRPYLWGLAAFGQQGVQRVVELLQGELRIDLGLSGAGNLKALDRSFIRPAWKAYKPQVTGSASR